MTNPSPFLPNTRFFPSDPGYMQREINLVYNDLANAINMKDIGLYTTQATSTGQLFFSTTGNTTSRPTLRQVFTAPSILNGTTSIAHGINIQPTTVFTRIYGNATQPSTMWLPIPYINVAAPADSIQLRVNGTNIEIITTTANYTAFSAMIILEFIPV